METSVLSLDGSWAGSYGYRGGRLPVAFEAAFTFAANGVDFTGWIRDNGPGGDAHIVGKQLGRNITFTKFYISPMTDTMTGKVAYSGVVSDDGNSITGQWKLGIFDTGPWHINRATAMPAGAGSPSWPPPISGIPPQLVAPELSRSVNLKPMTTHQFGGRLTLTKPQSPQAVGQTKGFVALSVVVPVYIAVLFWLIVNAVHAGDQSFGIRLLVRGAIGVFFLSFLWFRWYRIICHGDVYILDRDNDRIVRNTKTVGKFSDIQSVELKPIGADKTSKTVTLLLSGNRRIFVETGEPADTASLAGVIAQFAGVGVVADG